MLLPIALASVSDAAVGLLRISKFLTAEELAEPYAIDYERENAMDVDGDFTWEPASMSVAGGENIVTSVGGVKNPEERVGHKNEEGKRDPFLSQSGKEPVLPTTSSDEMSNAAIGMDGKEDPNGKPFELKNLKLKVPKGAFVAIVGRVGSGKVIQLWLNRFRINNHFHFFRVHFYRL
jgi:ABC-type multidrug transport system fused ATPase/permease subunit